MFQVTEKMHSAKALSYKQLKHEFDVASLLFSGRETDNNWESRQAFFKKVKVFITTDEAKAHKDELLDKLHEVMPRIYNTLKSNRTTLIEEALSLVEVFGLYVQHNINLHTTKAILRFLMSESIVTKKAIEFRAFEATNRYLAMINCHPEVLAFLCAKAQGENPQLREFALGYIKTMLSVHGSANKSRLIEYANLMQAIAASIQKGLVDAISTVRSACRETYRVFEELWPIEAYELAIKLDTATQRRLGFGTVQSSFAARKSAKPLIHRTSKSSASAIKKPVSSVCINRFVRSHIRAAMKKPSNPTSSSASKPQTHGLNVSNHCQAMTKKPGQAPSLVRKLAKPFIRRTSKSSASAIKKPASSVCINRAVRSHIRVAMKKLSNPAFSSTSKPHTHGLNLPKSHQAMTRKPGQAPSLVRKLAKPFIRRTLKSSASAIKKPASSVCINRFVRSHIRAAMKKPSNPTFSSASKPQTHGLNLPKSHQAMTRKPGQAPSLVRKLAKPFIRRTLKSSASAIKKPASSVCINRFVRSHIRAAMKKPSNPTFSSASKPQTHGLNLPNSRQAMTRKPGQAPSLVRKFAKPFIRRTSKSSASAIKKPASSVCINRFVRFHIRAAMQKPSNPAQTLSPAAIPHTERDATLGTTPSAASGTMMDTAPSTDSNTVMIITPNVNLNVMMDTASNIHSNAIMSTELNTTPILEPSPNTAISSPQVSSPQAKTTHHRHQSLIHRACYQSFIRKNHHPTLNPVNGHQASAHKKQHRKPQNHP